MDEIGKEQNAAELSAMDSMLAAEEEIAPSSGFLAGVMERVEEEARAPVLIPFPWKRALPGFVVVAVILGWGAVELVQVGIPLMREPALPAPHWSFAMAQPLGPTAWVALALGVSLASWLLARKLAGRTGLL